MNGFVIPKERTAIALKLQKQISNYSFLYC